MGSSEHRFIPLDGFREVPPDEMAERARSFRDEMQRRRTVRDFSDRDVPRGIIEDCLAAAASSPSGANLQPWHFVVVSEASRDRNIIDLNQKILGSLWSQASEAQNAGLSEEEAAAAIDMVELLSPFPGNAFLSMPPEVRQAVHQRQVSRVYEVLEERGE